MKPTADCINFFPRPRRFGKSLLISTLKALFQGRRELFMGLAIDENPNWDWAHETYPVVHLDMSDAACSDEAELNVKLNLMMKAQCAEFGIGYDASLPASGNFLNLLVSVNYSPRKNQRTINDVVCELAAPPVVR